MLQLTPSAIGISIRPDSSTARKGTLVAVSCSCCGADFFVFAGSKPTLCPFCGLLHDQPLVSTSSRSSEAP